MSAEIIDLKSWMRQKRRLEHQKRRTDREKPSPLDAGTLVMGVVVAILLVLAISLMGYQVFYTEKIRMDSIVSSTSTPVKPVDFMPVPENIPGDPGAPGRGNR